MFDRELVLTPAGKQRLQQELEELVTVRRAAVAEDIRQARHPGDLDESPEYSDAKTAQALIECRIVELRTLLGTARILGANDVPPDVTGLGTMVRVQDLDAAEEWEFTLVSSPEADPEEDRISIDCPLGEALLGCRTGETVTLDTPAGPARYRIVSLRPAEL